MIPPYQPQMSPPQPPRRASKRKTFLILLITLVVSGGVYARLAHRTIAINHLFAAISPAITDPCDRTVRPFGVMVSSDAEARPLSGIGQADVVFEMPVTDNGITRMMAVFQCQQPKEIGSIRSSRLDFIPLAQGLNAIYAHWGGEHTALQELDNHIIDNLDGLKLEGSTFYRKANIPRPHNGFSSYDLLHDSAVKHGYQLTTSTHAFIFEDKAVAISGQAAVEPPSEYAGTLEVTWHYDQTINSYLRNRGGTAEIDRTIGQPVAVKNVIILHTTWSPISKDYIRVQTLGSGQATIYKDGQAIEATWKKPTANERLVFYDTRGQEIRFAPYTLWIEIVVDNLNNR